MQESRIFPEIGGHFGFLVKIGGTFEITSQRLKRSSEMLVAGKKLLSESWLRVND